MREGRSPLRSGRIALAAAVVATAALAAAAGAGAAPPPNLQSTPLAPSGSIQGAKSATSRMAETDASLLGRRSADPVNVVVKLDYDSVATYDGHIAGLPATSPETTGVPVDPDSVAVRRYTSFIRDSEQAFLDDLDSTVPSATPGERLRTVYGGMALTLPANRVDALLGVDGVLAVQRDALEQLQTDSSPQFIGAPTLYSALGGAATAGRGVIVGVLDSGAWPEHPAFADRGNLSAPPPKADGTPRTCDFGDNPLTPATDVFVCQRKLISGQPFLNTYNAINGGEVYPDSARDSNGHGSHTATTAAGGPVADANPLGISRGAIAGIAPGAHVAVYKVCGAIGCYQSDSVSAVAQAVLDGVDVINFSISGGENPFSDAVELAFLDAYAAGIFVSASAGNDGAAGAVAHRSPWVTTVAASTQRRTYRSTLTLSGSAGATLALSGASITAGIASPAPVVSAAAPPYSNPTCSVPAPPGLFAGKIVACQRTNLRVLRGFNVRQGGAAGMILHNAAPADVMTDNHWLPTVHIDAAESAQLIAFLAANPATTGTLTAGAATTWQGDRLAYFSSRGPGGDWLKPDVTAPGLHILAGMTPTPEDPTLGPPGNLFQVIAGTSMSSPHVAGSAALVKALHPAWTPGQIKSALETTARTSGVTKPDGTTPADPFDVGGGRIDLTKAGDPGLAFDETAADYVAASADPLGRVDLNTPSVNAPVMPGAITTTRTATNVTDRTLIFLATAQDPAGTRISVDPPLFSVRPGRSVDLDITISAPAAAPGQYFGRVNLEQVNGSRSLHLPVAFNKAQGAVTLTQSCAPTTIRVLTGTSTCTATVQNTSRSAADVRTTSTTDLDLPIVRATGARWVNPYKVTASATLAGVQPDAPTIAPGSGPAGYIPLDAFGVTPIPVGDEQAVNFTLPAYRFAGRTYNRIGVVSNGYLVAGGTSSPAQISFTPQTLPDPAQPNNVLAPYWTDLDGTGAPGVYATTLTDGVSTWFVAEWRVNLYGTTDRKVFQVWIGLNGAEDISYAYDPAALPGAPPAGYGLTVGAENDDGSAGDQIAGPPTQDLVVTSTPAAPGGSFSYSYSVRGLLRGTSSARTDMTTPLVRGTTTEVDEITVNR